MFTFEQKAKFVLWRLAESSTNASTKQNKKKHFYGSRDIQDSLLDIQTLNIEHMNIVVNNNFIRKRNQTVLHAYII